MTIVSSVTDSDALTLTYVTEFDASIDRVWQLWSDPRQLERWWGPPTWPATFEQHDFTEGGRARYYMTGPDGEKARGWWQFTALDAPTRIEFADGFADENGEPDTSIDPTHAVVTLEDVNGLTRMTIKSTFVSSENMEEMVKMGMVDGMREALEQIDGILSEVNA
jgi:uncharacterized protein YndB with AHSA1/START domain